MNMLPTRMIDTPTCVNIAQELHDYPAATFICYVWATWCKPCIRIGPYIEENAVHHSQEAVFLKIDADGCVDFLRQHTIKSIPAILVLNRGNELGRLQGEHSQIEITHFIETSIAQSKQVRY